MQPFAKNSFRLRTRSASPYVRGRMDDFTKRILFINLNANFQMGMITSRSEMCMAALAEPGAVPAKTLRHEAQRLRPSPPIRQTLGQSQDVRMSQLCLARK